MVDYQWIEENCKEYRVSSDSDTNCTGWHFDVYKDRKAMSYSVIKVLEEDWETGKNKVIWSTRKYADSYFCSRFKEIKDSKSFNEWYEDFKHDMVIENYELMLFLESTAE